MKSSEEGWGVPGGGRGAAGLCLVVREGLVSSCSLSGLEGVEKTSHVALCRESAPGGGVTRYTGLRSVLLVRSGTHKEADWAEAERVGEGRRKRWRSDRAGHAGPWEGLAFTLGAIGASREFYAYGLCTAVRGIPRLALFI